MEQKYLLQQNELLEGDYFYRNLPDDLKIPDNIIWERATLVQKDIMLKEVDKCKNGVTIDGVFFPPTLYYYWNHCFIEVENDGGGFTIALPDLRDTDWIIHNAYYESNQESLGLIIGALRQVGKTTFLSTIVSWEVCFKKNAEIISIFSSKNDKESFTKKLDTQVKNNTNFLLPEILDKSWSKTLVRFGMREKDNTTIEFAKLYLLLTDGGSNTEISAGKSSSLAIFDEIAKAEMKEVHEALLPAMKSQKNPGKLRSSLVYSFTGGSIEKGQDARKIYENPTFNSFKAYPYKDREIGLFIPGEYHGSYKKKTDFKSFIENKGFTFNNKSISEIPIYVTHWELAASELDKEELIALNTDVTSYNKRKMYFPRTPDDIFLSGQNNIFSHLYKELEKINHYLKENPQGRNVEFREVKGEVVAIQSSKGRIIDYPVHYTDYNKLDTAIVLLEEPKYVRGQKFYVMGADVYNVVKTAESSSLGSWYIIKRQTTDYTDSYSDTMVCHYNGRTDLKQFREQLLLAMRYYGADDGACTLLHEAADDTFTQWFSEQNKAYMLEDTYQLAKEITPKSNTFAAKGLRATVNNQNYLISKTLEYCEEDIIDNKLGVWRIKDPYLVQQMMNFDGSLSDKDAIVSFSHALGHLYKEKKMRTPHYQEEVEEERKPIVNSIFGKSFKLRM